MAQETALFPMLDHLDRAECAFVRKWLGGEYLRLFDFARGPKKLNLLEIRSKFPDLTDEEYATLRSRLQDDIAEAVGEYHRQRHPSKKVQLHLGAAEAFMNKQQPEDAIRLLRKAISTAMAHEDHVYLMQMQGLRMQLPYYLPEDRRTEAKLEEIDLLLLQIADQHRQLDNRRELLGSALAISKGGYEGRTEKVLALMQAIPPFDQNIKSKSNLLLARTYWSCYDLLGNLEACIPVLDWAIALAQASPLLCLDIDAFTAFQRAFFKRSSIYSSIYDFRKSLQLIESFQAICSKVRKADPLILQDRNRLIRVRQLLHEGTEKEIVIGMRSTLLDLEKSGHGSNDQMSVIHRFLNYCLESRKFDDAIPWIAILHKKQFRIARTPKLILTYLFELSIYYGSGDISNLENALRRLAYHAKEKPSDTQFAKTIAEGFKSLAKAKADDTKPLATFVAKLEQAIISGATREYLEVYDLIGFLKDQIAIKKA